MEVDSAREGLIGDGAERTDPTPPPPKRVVCDNCRRRRIRCDGKLPCYQCTVATLACKRDHVPRKRGPKRGHGKVIDQLRNEDAQQPPPIQPLSSLSPLTSRELLPTSSSLSPLASIDIGLESPTAPDFGFLSDLEAFQSSNASPSSTPPLPGWPSITSHPALVPEPSGIFTSDELQPRLRDYLYMIPRCVDLYSEHVYPIMPIVYLPAIREMIQRPMLPPEQNLVYAMCALTSMHMSGKSIDAPSPLDGWEACGRFFLDECISVRQRYDFVEDPTLGAAISSFYLSTSFFEINQSRKSWFYLREALTLALDLGLDDASTYAGFGPRDVLCRQRVFWQLFITERSYAVLRNKPVTIKKTPPLPTTRHEYESPDIHAGFLQVISVYLPLDESFVTAWNEGSDPRVSLDTYRNLQETLAEPQPFLRPRTPIRDVVPVDEDTEPTDIQKADLLITQQWLRLIVWRSSYSQNLLGWSESPGSANSMCFSFPLTIAKDTASILASISSKAVEVHGMGIMEKIFDIGTWCVNVLGACEGVGFLTTMELAAGDLGLFGGGRMGAVLDPVEFFVRTLSATPNSRVQFAERLLAAAEQTPGSLRTALSPAPPGANTPWNGSGNIIGEILDDSDEQAIPILSLPVLPLPVPDLAGSSLQTPAVDNPGPGIMDLGETNIRDIDVMSELNTLSGTGVLVATEGGGYSITSGGGIVLGNGVSRVSDVEAEQFGTVKSKDDIGGELAFSDLEEGILAHTSDDTTSYGIDGKGEAKFQDGLVAW